MSCQGAAAGWRQGDSGALPPAGRLVWRSPVQQSDSRPELRNDGPAGMAGVRLIAKVFHADPQPLLLPRTARHGQAR